MTNEYKITHWHGHTEDSDEKAIHVYLGVSDEYITGMMAMAMSEKGDDWHTVLRIEKKLSKEELAELSTQEICGLAGGAYAEISENEYLVPYTNHRLESQPQAGSSDSDEPRVCEITFTADGSLQLTSKNIEVLNGFSYARTLLCDRGREDVEMKEVL